MLNESAAKEAIHVDDFPAFSHHLPIISTVVLQVQGHPGYAIMDIRLAIGPAAWTMTGNCNDSR